MVPYRETLDDGAIWPWGKRWATDTRTLDCITPDVARRLVDAASDMPLPGTILFLHDFHGHLTRISEADTAFTLRHSHFVAAAAARWEAGDEEDAAAQRSWVKRTADSLMPLAAPGGYVSFLAPSEADRVCDFYGSAAERLSAIKAQVDPSDLFRSAIGRLRSS